MSGAEDAKISRALKVPPLVHLQETKNVTKPKVAGSLWRIMAKATTIFKSALSDNAVLPTATPRKVMWSLEALHLFFELSISTSHSHTAPIGYSKSFQIFNSQ